MEDPYPVDMVALDLIDLDLRNSRFPRDAQSQSDAFELMMSTSQAVCLELLRDITRDGRLNSSDIPIVVAKDGRYVMMEGNRRLTCLRMWTDPDLLRLNEGLENQVAPRVERLVADSVYTPPTHLRVAIAPNEIDADLWIDRKHAGGAGGAGTVEWGSAMKDRRRARNDPSKVSRAMAFVAAVASEYEEEADIQVALEAVRTARYTMIQRFVDRSNVRRRLGLEFNAGKMSFLFGGSETKEIVRRVLTDFATPKSASGKTWARELDTVNDFDEYLDGYATLLPDRPGMRPGADAITGSEVEGNSKANHPSKGGETARPDSAKADAGVSGTGSDSGGDESRAPRPASPREHIFRDLQLDRFTPRIQEMVRMTSLLNAKRQNEIMSVMLRVILDLAAYQFLRSHGRDVPKSLDHSLKAAIKLIEPTASDALGTAESTSALSKAFHATTANSIRLVQYAVHDIHSGSTPAEVFTLADRYAPVLQAMNAHMGGTRIV